MNTQRLLMMLAVMALVFGLQTSSFAKGSTVYMTCTYTWKDGQAESQSLKALLAKGKVMTGYIWTEKKFLSKKTAKTYIVAVPTEAVAEFKSHGFDPLPANTRLSIKFSRVSLIFARTPFEKISRSVAYEFPIEQSEQADIFKLLTRMVDGPLNVLKEISEEKYDYITQKKQAAYAEASFHIDTHIDISCVDMGDNGDRSYLFQKNMETGSFDVDTKQ